VAQSFSGDDIILYILPVLWMTSCFHITGPYGGVKPLDLDDHRRQDKMIAKYIIFLSSGCCYGIYSFGSDDIVALMPPKLVAITS